ncbi:MAG: shikimate dehydrogenase, partial [Gammaproteobacteria bacterium]|nr:shikimate dehydrogenase [Gammaproteobacteria bacterium]
MDRYAVIGNPVAHSQSPRIHTLFAQQTGQDLSYRAILAPTDGFVQSVGNFRATGGKGLNVTLPFKLDARNFVDVCSQRAELAGAVNTISFLADGTTKGDNTDGLGLLTDLTRNNDVVITARDVLVLGAGGAVRGVLEPLIEAGPARLMIANRTVSRAIHLQQDFADLSDIEACGFADLQNQRFDLIINGTSAGIKGQMPPIPETVLRPGGCCYDMFYARQATPFVQWSKQHEAAKSLDGIGMLVEQAAESFLLWRGVRPDTRPVI